MAFSEVYDLSFDVKCSAISMQNFNSYTYIVSENKICDRQIDNRNE